MRRRLRKKLHKRVLEFHVIDLSVVSAWRVRLFDAPLYQAFPIDRTHLADVPKTLAGQIRARELRFQAAKVSPAEVEPWISDGGLVVFRFQSCEFPSARVYSGNNPDVR